MRRVEVWLLLALGASAGFGARPARAQAVADASPPGVVRARAPTAGGHPPSEGSLMPVGGNPQGEGDEDEDEPLPPGHPATTAKPGTGAPGVFTPPSDTESEDITLPPGTIALELRDARNHALPETGVTLGILHQSVAKGESREHKAAISDMNGNARFDGLETGSSIAYRITVSTDGATFAALPFQLPAQKGMRVVLHVYPVSRDIQEASVVLQGVLFVEVKDDRLQIEEVFTVFNLGEVAWLAERVMMRLPNEFSALAAQQTMSDQGVDSIEKQGGQLHGTFAPGRHEVQFRWQLPYSGENAVDFDVGLPPHVAAMRVLAGASRGSKLRVTGFPEAEPRADPQGRRVLLTEKQLRRDEPITDIHVSLDGLPTPGPGRIIATLLSGFIVTMGLAMALTRAGRASEITDDKSRRALLLAELAELVRARETEDVGLRTYERRRREIIDAIASTLGTTAPAPHRETPTV